jgi:pyruvate-formate lyase
MALHVLLQMRRLPEPGATLLTTMAADHSVRHTTTTTFRAVIQIIQLRGVALIVCFEVSGGQLR